MPGARPRKHDSVCGSARIDFEAWALGHAHSLAVAPRSAASRRGAL